MTVINVSLKCWPGISNSFLLTDSTMVTEFVHLGKPGVSLLLNLGLFLFLWSWEAGLGVGVPGNVGIPEKSGVCLLEQFKLVYRKPKQNRRITSVLCLL